jgi:hypothetical protein
VVHYQACNDRACFAPKDEPFSVTITLKEDTVKTDTSKTEIKKDSSKADTTSTGTKEDTTSKTESTLKRK